MPFYVKDGVIINVRNYNLDEKWPDVDTIGASAFDNTFTYELVVPETIKKITSLAFSKIRTRKITLPFSMEKLDKMVFLYNDYIREVIFNSSLKEIPENTFTNCSSLEKIIFPRELETIKNYAFSKCSSLKNITLPNTLKEIENNAFSSCYCLDKINFPNSVEKIGKMAFLESGVVDIKIPNNIKEIGDYAFSNCGDLKTVDMSNSTILELNEGVFSGCLNLEKVILPKKLLLINSDAFNKCKKIERIELPKSVKCIGKMTFSFCSSLSKIDLSNIEKIDRKAFNDCYNLKNITFSNNLYYIGESCFENCENLKNIDLSKTNIEQIKSGTFLNCTNLEKVELPNNIERIGRSAFYGCEKLKDLKFPSNLKYIEGEAFSVCESLESLYFPDGLQYIGNEAFYDCINLKEISFPKNVEINPLAFSKSNNYQKIYCYDIEKIANQNFAYDFINEDRCIVYINNKTGQYLLAKSNIRNKDSNFKVVKEIDEYKEKLNCNTSVAIILYKNGLKVEELKSRNLLKEDMYEKIIEFNFEDKIKDIYNTKEFLGMINRKNIILDHNEISKDYFKLAFNLGAFNNDNIIRQKACNFIENLCDKGLLSGTSVHSIFDSMEPNGYNSEWVEFIMNKDNLQKLFEKENEESGFISRTYNEFNSIKEFARSNRGSQRYRKVTVEACEEYFSKVTFAGVDDKTMDISSTISAFTRNQSSFDLAKKIRNEYLENKEKGLISDHILKSELKEENVFEQIKEEKEKIINDTQETLDKLNDISNEYFTYEFLSKYDPRNFVLGKYCCCCAHLEGAGASIMKASILHPDCQNLIIKNKEGKIIAKSTLYINRKQGYGVFNNVEVNTNVREEYKELIYKKYKKAIEDFVRKYNEINEIKLKQINVGMHLNDLSQIIEKKDEEGDILPGIDFSAYGIEGHSYKGDWQDEQYVLWKKK